MRKNELFLEIRRTDEAINTLEAVINTKIKEDFQELQINTNSQSQTEHRVYCIEVREGKFRQFLQEELKDMKKKLKRLESELKSIL